MHTSIFPLKESISLTESKKSSELLVRRLLLVSVLVFVFGFANANAQVYTVQSHSTGGSVTCTTDGNGAPYCLSKSGGDYEGFGATSIPYTTYFWVFTEDTTYSALGYVNNNGGATPYYTGVAPGTTTSFVVDGVTIYGYRFIGSQCTSGCADPVVFTNMNIAFGSVKIIYGVVATTSSATFWTEAEMYSAIEYVPAPPSIDPLDSWNGTPGTTTQISPFTNAYGDYWYSGLSNIGFYYWDMTSYFGTATTTKTIRMVDMLQQVHIANRYINLIYDASVSGGRCPSYVKNLSGQIIATNVNGIGNPSAYFSYLYTPSGVNHYVQGCVYDTGVPETFTQGMQFVDGTVGIPYSTLSAGKPLVGIFSSSNLVTSASYTSLGFLTFISDHIQFVFVPHQSTGIGYISTSSVLANCESFDIGCYMSNSLQYVFYPDPQAVARFNSLTLASSAPFAYLYDMDTVFEEFFNTSTTTVLAWTIPFPMVGSSSATLTLISKAQLQAVPYVGLWKTILTALIWLSFGWYVWERLLRVHDKTT